MKEQTCENCGDKFDFDWNDGFDTGRTICRECQKEIAEGDTTHTL